MSQSEIDQKLFQLVKNRFMNDNSVNEETKEIFFECIKRGIENISYESKLKAIKILEEGD